MKIKYYSKIGISLFLLFIFSAVDYCSVRNDTILNNTEEGLIVITQKLDEINKIPEKPCLDPSSNTMNCFAAILKILDTTKVMIKIKDAYNKTLIIFHWKLVAPGAYKFNWWEYYMPDKSGVYNIEKIIGGKSKTYRAIIVL